MSIGDELVAGFARIVRSGGGDIRLLGEDRANIRIGFTPGEVEPCADGMCVLPHLELQKMMREWLARRAPDATVTVVPERGDGA